MASKTLPTAEELRRFFNYDPETGRLTWAITEGRAVAGNDAGTINEQGYRIVGIDRSYYKAHRIIYRMMTGEEPPSLIDHINGDPGDNRWRNIRPATEAQNNANRRKQRNNKSGFRGVHWDKESGRWRAAIRVNKRLISLGRFSTKESAHSAYCKASAQLFGDFGRTS